MAPRPSQTPAALAAIEALQHSQDDRLGRIEHMLAEDRRLMLERMDDLHGRVTALAVGVAPLAETVKAHAERHTAAEKTAEDHAAAIAGLKLFRARIGAAVGLAGTAAGMLVAGAGYLLTTFWSDIAAAIGLALKRLFP
jgi:hypothetical protein